MSSSAPDAPPPAWHSVYPSPTSTVDTISREDLLSLMDSGAMPGKEFLLIDLRRVDHQGGTIEGSINLPAESLYPTIPVLYNLVTAANIKTVIWYCGSSRGRGPRAAGWFADYLNTQSDVNVRSIILAGGIKGWVASGEQYTQRMAEYDHSKWDPASI